MPSGGITITPGYHLAAHERVNNAKLNQLGQPVGRIDEGSIGERELNVESLQTLIATTQRNLLCNGSFRLFDANILTGLLNFAPYSGDHEYSSARRWVIANDANRTASKEAFTIGVIEIPDAGNPTDFLRWAQSAPLSVNPGYLGQRLEDVRKFSGQRVTFSIYVRSAAPLTVTPKVRQFFGNPVASRTITGTISEPDAGGVVADAGNGFLVTDVGSTIVISKTGFPTTTGIITDFSSAGIIYTDCVFPYAENLLNATISVPQVSSAPVVTNGTPLVLVANTWTRLVQTWDVPSVAGKTVPDVNKSFTEFRVEMPQGQTFQVDFANAQLELGPSATPFETRIITEETLFAMRYRQTVILMLSGNLSNWNPNGWLFDKLDWPQLVLFLAGGTGATIRSRRDIFGNKEFWYQATAHSVVATAGLIADCELRD